MEGEQKIALKDEEMTPHTEDSDDKGKQIDTSQQDAIVPEVNESLKKELEEMGFSSNRSIRALYYTGSDSIETVVNWIVEHENDSDIDEPLLVSKNAVESNLTPEEAKIKAKELIERARKKKEEEEKRMEREREKERIRIGREILEAKRHEEDNERKRIIQLKQMEKEEERKAREKIKAKIEEDRIERRRRLGLPIEEEKERKEEKKEEIKKPFVPIRPVTQAEKMRNCLRNLKQTYNKGEDAAKIKKTFQTLLTYVKNVGFKPEEEKFRRIRLSNPTFQDRVGNFAGGVEFLELCGFEKDEGGENLIMPEGKISVPLLETAAGELNSAITNPFFGVL